MEVTYLPLHIRPVESLANPGQGPVYTGMGGSFLEFLPDLLSPGTWAHNLQVYFVRTGVNNLAIQYVIPDMQLLPLLQQFLCCTGQGLALWPFWCHLSLHIPLNQLDVRVTGLCLLPFTASPLNWLFSNGQLNC